jgi:urease subunit alpha
MSRAAIECGVPERLGLERGVLPVGNTRTLQKMHMVRNGALPHIEIDPETYQVYVDGKLATVPPADHLSLAQFYFIV